MHVRQKSRSRKLERMLLRVALVGILLTTLIYFAAVVPSVSLPDGADLPDEGSDLDNLQSVLAKLRLNYMHLESTRNFTPIALAVPAEDMWRQHPHLIVFWILSTDKAERRQLRDYQRRTWFTFPNVATLANRFVGHLLPLYVSTLLNLTPPYISDEMVREVNTWGDTLLLPLYEEPPTQHKDIDRWGYYGRGLHVTNSRKVFSVLLYTYNAFPDAPFIGKGDDDMFMFVPELLKSVQQLPRLNVVYGKVRKYEMGAFPYGMAYLMSRDVAYDAVTFSPLADAMSIPFNPSLEGTYMHLCVTAEDEMVTRSLHLRFTDVRREPPHGWERADYNAPADLPPPTGWGKLYNEYIRPNSTVPRTGTVPDPGDGTPTATYSFPEHPDPSKYLLVSDGCRMKNYRKPRKSTQVIVAHRVVTEENFKNFFTFYKEMGNRHMIYPRTINVGTRNTSVAYIVPLVCDEL